MKKEYWFIAGFAIIVTSLTMFVASLAKKGAPTTEDFIIPVMLAILLAPTAMAAAASTRREFIAWLAIGFILVVVGMMGDLPFAIYWWKMLVTSAIVNALGTLVFAIIRWRLERERRTT